MKGFLAIESSWVHGPHIVRMQVSRCLPRLTITKLRVRCIATRQPSRLTFFDLKSFWAIELNSGVTFSPRRSRCRGRSRIAAPRRGRVINRLQIGGISHHWRCTVLVCCCVQLGIRLWDQRVIETSWGEVVWGHVKGLRLEDGARLLGYRFTEMLVIYADLGTVACVAWHDFWLLWYLYLLKCLWDQ